MAKHPKKEAPAVVSVDEAERLMRLHLLALQERKRIIEDQTRPLREKREALFGKILPMQDEARALTAEIRAIEGDEIAELSKSIGMILATLGARKLSQA